MSGFTLDTHAGEVLNQARVMERTNLLGRNGAATDPAKMREVAVEFEAMFLAQMLQPLFESIETEAPFGGGEAEKMWRGLMVDEYGRAMARAGGIGIADDVMRQMLKMQEAQQQ